MMASRKQKKVWRYVEEGSLLKLKSYLRKHKDVEVNFTRGKRRRSVLHLVCSHGDDALLRLLLKHGADPLQKDRSGNTPLHLAVRRALSHGLTDYNDLVVPLRKHCPAALSVPNNAGVTPHDLLEGLSFKKKWSAGADAPQPSDPEKEWREKLLGECQDEFFETFGQYDDDFLRDDEDEGDFADWAERIRREYVAKQHARAQADSKRSRKNKEKNQEEQERQRRELHARLEKEHREYLERASRKKDETQQGRKRRYEERCDDVFLKPSSSGVLGYEDIPWPAPRGSVEEMIAVILHGVDRSDTGVFRKFLRRQQALWHPDKFAQRCGGRLQDRDRQRIMDTVTALSQELNRLAQSLR
ncbi:NF-kappa-B inhibitor-like protein 1 [Clarias gariepinus]|uniref:NF-kappa-B inhibitor-like protein 1 n=1 Tax=Clarias gariepinus TaxID=13013 RepID=UPI00234C6D20|nr:NF-kappa-B inhibitor-like protein 1 [Clarias gariepinus]XP_053331813.1 NF-kappa-B inhibitor-like protein 1 [Clarias gariepinus]